MMLTSHVRSREELLKYLDINYSVRQTNYTVSIQSVSITLLNTMQSCTDTAYSQNSKHSFLIFQVQLTRKKSSTRNLHYN